jgi:hypothetical protein
MSFVFRLALGSLLYCTIVVIAAELPVAAGLMLTFPALNGLGLFYLRPERVAVVARTMLLMPIINGLLCGLYILLFSMFVPETSSWKLASGVLLLVCALWGICYGVIEFRRRAGKPTGISDASQWRYAVACSVMFGVLGASAAVAVGLIWEVRAPTSGSICSVLNPSDWLHARDCALQRLEDKKLLVGLFIFGLGVFVWLASLERISDEFRGFLGGLPLVPFGGLFTLAFTADAGSIVDTFRLMGCSVLASPVVPIWFICLFSRLVGWVQSRLLQLSGLILFWGACLIAIYLISIPLLSLSAYK